jgi:hypothetical protein
MATRLGQILYWAACGIAIVWLVMVLMRHVGAVDRRDVIIGVAGAALAWLIGRAAKYILVGR